MQRYNFVSMSNKSKKAQQIIFSNRDQDQTINYIIAGMRDKWKRR